MQKLKALVGGDILTPRGLIRKGLALVRDGKIEYAGPMKKYRKSAYETIDLSGKVVSPGLIDAHTHLGVYAEGSGEMGEDGNEMVDPVTPQVRAIDSIDPSDKAFEEARAAGVTAVMIAPGSANVIGGSVCVSKPAAASPTRW